MDSNSDDAVEKAKQTLSAAIDRNIERGGQTASHLDRTLISLSAGALLLSITLVPILAPLKLALPVLFLAWMFFITSMILVISAMRVEQTATEEAVRDATDHLKKLEEHPEIAREFITQTNLPIVEKKVTESSTVATLNKWALRSFIAGVVCLIGFAGYNLWHTPPLPPETRQHA